MSIESGEWPTAAVSRRIGGVGFSNALDTPVGTPDPSRVGTPNHSEYSCAMDDDEVSHSLPSPFLFTCFFLLANIITTTYLCRLFIYWFSVLD